ncbi:hypothetical protein JQS43_17490 [Natronosporangium hydrolyticum]|uniref:Uncharacterized protein n=1 Tax=Natronosporangium hydrolyticum TaxID=2811111 RepID=A0A895Y7S1_9ACTN|nr:hypothetical protein [Natronosporangium hydrolyticum]QSB13401.1 hypothetical protein JQS43_17490 [Natronosporangium hydrolyticum]
MSAQKVATAVALAALAALFLSVGIPTLVPPAPVGEISLSTGEDDESTGTPDPVPRGRPEPGTVGTPGDPDDSPDSPDSSDSEGDHDSPDTSADVSPDDDGVDDDD